MSNDETKVEIADGNVPSSDCKIEVIEQEWDETNSPIKPKKSFFSLLMKIILGFIGILIFVFIVVFMFHDAIVSTIVSKAGTLLVGTPVKLGKFNLSLTGKVEVADFTVGNPKGYHNLHAFKLKRIFVDVDLPSILTSQVVVNKIEIDGVTVGFESKIKSNNLNEIKANVENNIANLQGGKTINANEESADSAKKAAVENNDKISNKPGKSLLIKSLIIRGTSLIVSNSTIKTSVKLPVANISMTNIGGNGKSIAVVVDEILNAFFVSIQDALSHGTKIIRDAGISLGNSILNTGKNLGKSVLGVGDSTVEKVKDAGKSAVEGTKKAGKAIKESTKKLFDKLKF